MSRSDSGYQSNLAKRPGYYGDPGSILQEETDDYQCDDSGPTWHQYNLEPMDATYDQQLSNYMVEGTGSHMASYYPNDTTPRTTYEDAHQGMELLDDNSLYLELEQQHWAAHLDAQYSHGSYHDHAGPSTLPPTQDDGSSTTFQDLPTSPTVPSSSSSNPPPTTRHPLPSTAPSTQPTAAANDDHQTFLTSPTMTAPTATTPSSNKFPCLMPSCNKQFNRAADLDRHMKFIHCKSTVAPMLCDYRRCARHRNPFHRADHFRDHLRDQHKEDLLKRGGGGSNGGGEGGSGNGNGGPDAGWWRERAPGAVYGGWWRCGKCFARVVVERDLWQCGSCGNYCEGDRQGVRRLPRGCEYIECTGGQCGHEECVGEGAGGEWLSPAKFRSHLREAHGEDVPVKEGKEGDKELASEEWWEGRKAEAVYSPVWRCTRCLGAVDSREDGFTCGSCGFGCEEARRGWHGGL